MNRVVVTIVALFIFAVACAPTATPRIATATLSSTTTPTLTPAPTITPTPTPIAVTATTWASDANGKVAPQKMYRLVGAINYKHRMTIDLMFGQLRLAVVTDQDLTKFNVNVQKDLRTKLAAILEQHTEFKRGLENLRAKLVQLYPTEPNLIVVIESEKPMQAIFQQDDNLLRYKVEFDAKGIVNLVEWTNFTLLPKLTVEGPYLKRTDNISGNEMIVQFKGVNLHSFRTGNKTFSEAKQYVDIAKTWGSNVLRILVDIGGVEDAELDKTVNYAEKLGMYLIVAPARKNGTDFTQPTPESNQFVTRLAEKFKIHNNVLYGILNEVGNPKNDQWYDDAVTVSKEIKLINQNANIVLPGWFWNRDFSIYQRKPFPIDAIYDVHLYKAIDGNGTDITTQYMNHDWMRKKRAVIYGEAGVPFQFGGRNNPDDVKFISLAIDSVNSDDKASHWISFEIAPGNFGSSILSDSKGTPSTRGRPYYDDLQKNPSTQFDR